jgi:hypothetical protein
MKEYAYEMMDAECTWWSIEATIHENGRTYMRVLSGGIVQDIIPNEIAIMATIQWGQWLNLK